jgi:hypothetical protein
VEPRFLRAYLIDERNKRHRKQVLDMLAGFYAPVINHVENRAASPELKAGMIKLLESLRAADQPIVSLRVTELMDGKPSGKSGAGERQKRLREDLVGGKTNTGGGGGILDEFAMVSPPIQAPPGIIFPQPPPPIGHQLIAFAEAPDEAKNAHIEVTYELKPGTEANAYRVEVTITIRTDVEGQPVATDHLLMPMEFTLAQLDGAEMDRIRDQIVKDLVGKS